jgi:hypothetical protein
VVHVFDYDEKNTIKDEHNRNDLRVVKMFVQKVIEQQTKNADGHGTDNDFQPQLPGALFLLRCFALAEGIQTVAVKRDNRKNRTKLNDN